MARSSRPASIGRTRVRAAAWFLAGVLVALAEAAIVWAARGVDKLYAADPYWLIAGYAEPWRTNTIAVVILATLGVSLNAALERYPVSWPRFLATLAAMLAGLAICVELTTAVHLNDALGELYVHTFVFRRDKVSFQRSDGAWCVRVDFTDPFAWRLNGAAIHPRLLPLPYESSAVIGRLLRASRACGAR